MSLSKKSEKMRVKKAVRKAGLKVEREFFGKGGALEVKTNPVGKKWYLGILESGTLEAKLTHKPTHENWLRARGPFDNKEELADYVEVVLGKDPGSVKGLMEAFLSKKNPLRVRTQSSINEVDYMKSHGWDLIVGTRQQPKVYSRTVGSDFQTIQKEARYYRLLNKGFLNTELQSVGEFPLLTDAIIRADKVGTRKELFQGNPKFEHHLKFKNLSIGEVFHFSSEGGVYSKAAGGVLQWQGARGPWVKTGERKYEHTGERGVVHTVGTVNVGVSRITEYTPNPITVVGLANPPLVCRLCGKTIRGRAGEESYNEETHTNSYTCLACVKKLSKAIILPNPPRSVSANIEGIVYNRCIEIRAEKTGYKKGFYKHPFSRGSQVCIYALDNGDLLVHSKAGVKLWQPD